MKILFIGDVYGRVGREMVATHVKDLRSKHQIDVVIANGENATHGRGISPLHYQELLSAGVDIVTMGNHFFSHNNPNSFYLKADHMVRPANIHPSAAGYGSRHFDINGHHLRVTNLLGRVYMADLTASSPFEALDKILEENTDVVHIVDFHAEATAEKLALAYCYDGKVSAILGTHTHVPTADNHVFDNGLAYISDVGMCGPYKSIIGANIEQIIHKTKTGIPMHFDVATGPGVLNAVIIEIDEANGKALSIDRLQILPSEVTHD